ncbi:MAG TPA: hypothetical protein VMM58_08295 [Bacteroidota bacterium]|nr:hypothetical protein [Bacteroidota bacterium]
MGIFADVGVPFRVVASSALLQMETGGNAEEFRKRIRESIEKTIGEAAVMRTAYETAIADSRIKSSQVVRGSLNAYLSTPIKTDNEEVQKIIGEALEKFSEQVLPTLDIGVASAWSARVLPEGEIISTRTKLGASVRKMLLAGKRTLQESGSFRGKNAASAFEIVYVVKSAMNLDLLEASIRRSQESAAGAPALPVQAMRMDNVILSTGPFENTGGLWEGTFYPRALGMPDKEFVQKVEILFAQLSKEFNLHQLSFWEKKFSRAGADNFSVRIRMIPDHKLLFEVVKALFAYGDEAVKKRFEDGTPLVVKEILP